MRKLGSRKNVPLSTFVVATFAVPTLVATLSPRTARAQEAEPFLPYVRPAPLYPKRALELGVEGHVVVEYTVTEDGTTEDLTIIDSTSSLFEEAALEPVRWYRYEPRIENGEPVAVPGVRTIIRFVLD